jgi:hypothetical protein
MAVPLAEVMVAVPVSKAVPFAEVKVAVPVWIAVPLAERVMLAVSVWVAFTPVVIAVETPVAVVVAVPVAVVEASSVPLKWYIDNL